MTVAEHRIEGFRVHVVHVPAKTTHSHGSGDVSGINAALLELSTDTGLTGWGEASPWPVFTGTVEGSAAALHTHLRPHVLGTDPVQVTRLMHVADSVLVGHPEAKAALECALLDLAGQIAGLSIAEMVGGISRNEIGLSFSVANPDFEADLEDVARLREDGIRIFKLKTGFKEHGFDLMRLERLRTLYGDEISLRIDYNQGLAAHDAIRTVRDLEAFRPDFVEQPVKRHERAALAAITQAVDVPVMADESVFGVVDAVEGAHMRIADIFSLKIMKAGGIRRCLEVAAVARAAGIGVYCGCMFETSIAHAAGTHLAAALPELTLGCEFYMSTYFASADITDPKLPVSGGKVRLPQGAGLGVRPDPDSLARHRIELLDRQ